MTVAIPAVTFPGGGTGRDTAGHRPASGLLVIMAGPIAPVTAPGSQPVPTRWSKDRSGLWLRNAAVGLCVLAAAAAAVSFTAFGGLRYQKCLDAFEGRVGRGLAEVWLVGCGG